MAARQQKKSDERQRADAEQQVRRDESAEAPGGEKRTAEEMGQAKMPMQYANLMGSATQGGNPMQQTNGMQGANLMQAGARPGMQGDVSTVEQVLAQMQTEPEKHMTQERISKAWDTLMRYKTGKSRLESRLVEVEQWWKLRHWEWMQEKGAKGDMQTTSAWLFNVIISKHADGIQSIPEANVLPREQGDKETARKLSAIIPCVLEGNGFDEVYSDVLWQKLKGGTGAYGVFWDKNKLNGLGDITIERVNLLHLFWEPGVRDIQKSQNVFLIEPVDKELLKQQYPQLEGEALSRPMSLRKFLTEDRVSDEDKAYVVDWYYHTYQGGKKVLHYCKFVGDVVLYATEDQPELAERGLYDHGLYPFVLDALFPVEGSPCGFGYIDVCKGAQEQIDILNQAVVRNTLVNAIPRYFIRSDGGVNEEEFMDFTRPVVHVTGTLGTDSVQPITTPTLNGNCITMINNKITELKETSGNTDSSNGITQSSSQAASAIAALQEASGKVSRAATMSAYRAFCRIVNQIIELIRQFYELPRQFRITGEQGEEQYMSFDNAGMQPQAQGMDFGMDMGYRLPVFDVKVSAQTKTAYNKNSQNELALSLYQNGIFNPQMSDQALMLLDMMDFDGKDELQQKVSANGTLLQQMAMYQQIALQLAQQTDPALAEQLAQSIMSGGAAQDARSVAVSGDSRQGVGNDGGAGGNITKINNARARAQDAAQPAT